MEIDFEKIGAVVERLEREISKGALKAAVTIGAREGGNVFRLEVVCAEEAEDVAEVMDWARCIVPSNVKVTGAAPGKETNHA